ncbi:hypothetical protein PO909_003502 [Leuciscus waleckii]
MASSSGKTLHSEYILIYPIDATNTSPLDKILRMPNDDQSVVLYTYYSPCIEKCINDKADTILYDFSNWLNTQRTGIKALVFQEIWRKDWTGVRDQFAKINNLVPLYRCVKENSQMKCYKCEDAGRSSEEKQQSFRSENKSIFFLIIQAVKMASLKCVIVLCLLHLRVQSIQGDVNPAVLAKMIQYFDDK